MEFKADILKLFQNAYKNDLTGYIKPWMINWEYQDKRIKRKVKYKENLPQDFYKFSGPNDIIEWMNWVKVVKPNYFPSDIIDPLLIKSYDFDKKIIEKYNIPFDFSGYMGGIAMNNAQDFILANFYPMMHSNKNLKILDFGAGYGRQANLWSQHFDDNTIFISIDAIPKSYCLQHFYYSNIDYPYYDYVVNKDFSLNQLNKGIYHLPTWRFDLIPDNFFDKIIVVQVLQELNETLAKYVIKQFHRVLNKNGVLYIRDHKHMWRPTHKLNIDNFIKNSGFTLEFEAHIVDKKDLHGIPRIYRKTNPEVLKQQKISKKQLLTEWRESIDAITGGKLKKVFKRTKY